jgi:hypothetical protein
MLPLDLLDEERERLCCLDELVLGEVHLQDGDCRYRPVPSVELDDGVEDPAVLGVKEELAGDPCF